MNLDKLFEEGFTYINVRRNLNDTPPRRPLVVNYVATVRMGGSSKPASATHVEPEKALKLAIQKLDASL